MRLYRTLVVGGLFVLASWVFAASDVSAAQVVTVPILTEIQVPEGEAPQTVTMSWDHERTPDPLFLQWAISRVQVRGAAFEPLMNAFAYAMAYQSTNGRPTGTLSLSTTISTPLHDDGLSAGAALAVGFLAVFRGDRLMNHIALVGVLEPTGWISPVRGIGNKIRMAARDGYQVVLVPKGQLSRSSIKLVGMGIEPNIHVREVDTIEEAYVIMTGKKL